MNAGRVRRERGGLQLEDDLIPEVGKEGYKYLGIDQHLEPKSDALSNQVSEEYLKRVRVVWGSPLNIPEVNLHNTWAIGVMRYYCGAADWPETWIKSLDRKIRGILASCGVHNRQASVRRLYLPRDKGGRGLISARHVWEQKTVSLALYARSLDDLQVQGALQLHKWVEENLREDTIVSKGRKVLHSYEVSTYSGQLRPC